MTQPQGAFQNRRKFLALSAGGLLIQVGCNSTTESIAKPKEIAKSFKMGERAAVGLLTYTILESSFYTQLGNPPKTRMAQKRFLVLRLAITNGGAKEMEVPLFKLMDESGELTPELEDGEGVPGWFGIIRRVGPTMTEEGRIVFDVAPKNYKLQVTDGGETGAEQFAYIEIPMEFDTTESVPGATAK
jgi:hypothetical protein